MAVEFLGVFVQKIADGAMIHASLKILYQEITFGL